MPFNGSGTFSIVNTFIPGTTILSSAVNENNTDIATGLSTTILKNGTQTVTADVPFGAFGVTDLGWIDSASPNTVASAGTCNILGSDALFVTISGTTTITSFGTRPNTIKFVIASGAFTITHNATSLILPGAANITTVAGDTFTVISDASGNARVISYQPTSSFSRTIIKSTDETIQSDNTPSTDAALQFTMAANTKYIIELDVRWLSGSTPDIKWTLAGPASPTIASWIVTSNSPGGGNIQYATGGGTYPTNQTVNGDASTTIPGLIYYKLVVQNGANAGTWGFQWSQNTSTASDTTVLAGSSLTYRVVD